MKRTIVLILAFMSMFWGINSICADISKTDITFETVQPAGQLSTLLRDKIDDIQDEIDQKTLNVGTGDIFYVDSAVGSDTYDGTKPEWAKATLDAAIALCADGNHDTIYVMSGHAETISTITLDIDDITIIGIGSGVDMPEFTFDTTTDEIIIDAQGVTVYNLRFLAGVAEVANCFDLQDESDYALITGCEFPEPATATHEFDKVFQLVTGADNVTIAYNTWINQAATPGSTSFVDGGAAAIDSLTLIGNYINADADVAALLFSDQADTNLLVADNTVIQEDVDQYCIELTSTATGLIKGNTFFNLGGSTFYMDPGTCHVEGNTGDPVMDATAGFGNTWYVDDGGSNGDGLSWETAKTTLAAAEALCVAGDTILVGQLHNENLTTGGDTINIAGVTVRGMGEGDKRPLFDMDADSDELTIDAAGITLDNLRFRPGATALTSGIRVEDAGIGCVIKNCAFVDGEAAATDEWIDCISVDTSASDLTIENCTFYGTGTDGDTFVNLDEATIANATVKNCKIYGDFDESAIWWGAAVPTNLYVADNTITNILTGQSCIEGSGNATGVCENNRLAGDTYGAILVQGLMRCYGNIQTVADDGSAIDVPLIAGKTYGIKVAADEVTQNLLDIQNGGIMILSIFAEVDVVIGASVTTCKLNCDADDGAAWDCDLSTAVAITDDAAGTRWFMDDAGIGTNPPVLDPRKGGATEGTLSVCPAMWVPEGLLIQTMSADPGGAAGDHVTWYIRFSPVEDGVVVIPQ